MSKEESGEKPTGRVLGRRLFLKGGAAAAVAPFVLPALAWAEGEQRPLTPSLDLVLTNLGVSEEIKEKYYQPFLNLEPETITPAYLEQLPSFITKVTYMNGPLYHFKPPVTEGVYTFRQLELNPDKVSNQIKAFTDQVVMFMHFYVPQNQEDNVVIPYQTAIEAFGKPATIVTNNEFAGSVHPILAYPELGMAFMLDCSRNLETGLVDANITRIELFEPITDFGTSSGAGSTILEKYKNSWGMQYAKPVLQDDLVNDLILQIQDN